MNKYIVQIRINTRKINRKKRVKGKEWRCGGEGREWEKQILILFEIE
jgi:hypothetical protein